MSVTRHEVVAARACVERQGFWRYRYLNACVHALATALSKTLSISIAESYRCVYLRVTGVCGKWYSAATAVLRTCPSTQLRQQRSTTGPLTSTSSSASSCRTAQHTSRSVVAGANPVE